MSIKDTKKQILESDIANIIRNYYDNRGKGLENTVNAVIDRVSTFEGFVDIPNCGFIECSFNEIKIGDVLLLNIKNIWTICTLVQLDVQSGWIATKVCYHKGTTPMNSENKWFRYGLFKKVIDKEKTIEFLKNKGLEVEYSL